MMVHAWTSQRNSITDRASYFLFLILKDVICPLSIDVSNWVHSYLVVWMIQVEWIIRRQTLQDWTLICFVFVLLDLVDCKVQLLFEFIVELSSIKQRDDYEEEAEEQDILHWEVEAKVKFKIRHVELTDCQEDIIVSAFEGLQSRANKAHEVSHVIAGTL